MRLINCICMFIFSLSLGALIFSGVALSNYIFSGLNIPYIMNWRAVHLASAIITLFVLFIHLLVYINRYIKNRSFKAIAVALFVIAVVSIFGMPYLDRWFHRVEVDSNQIIQGKQVNLSDKVITVSRVGNTDFPEDVDAVSGASVMKDKEEIIGNAQMIAMMVNNTVGGDMFEIKTVDKYPSSYSETTKVAKVEFNDDNKIPTLKQPLPDLNDVDTLIIIYPLWWSSLPRAVETFLSHYDLTNKKLIPIVTHGGGGIGESVEVIKRVTKAKVVDPLDIYSSDISSSRDTIYNYLSSVRFK